MNLKTVLIGIQARSSSTRLPGKCYESLGGKTVTDAVIESCKASAANLNQHSHRNKYVVRVSLLVPYGDGLEKEYMKRCPVVAGPLEDVLSRYRHAAECFNADYIVRVTGDCPHIPSPVITKHIKSGIAGGFSYLANCDEDVRTAFDGMDCEFMTRELLEFLNDRASDKFDREHVTSYARRESRKLSEAGFRIGHTHGHIDLSHIKLSVDTLDDLERVRKETEKLAVKYDRAVRKYGKQNVLRY